MNQINFMEIGEIKVGHAQNLAAATGCTVLIIEKGGVVGGDVRGGAPGTRETDLLDPVNLVERVHGILLTGGSAFGLDAAAGVMEYLEKKKIGFDVQVTRVPIVCGAALFDLTIGDPLVRPDKKMGYQACVNAGSDNCDQGCVGAGTGATVGKILGMERAMKGGLGHYAIQVKDLKVGAMVAVNCLGDIIDPLSGEKIVGVLSEDFKSFADTEEIMINSYSNSKNLFSGNTTLGVIATNAALTKAQATKLASMAQNGYARTMRPAHSMLDGDTIFAMSVGNVEADLSVVGLLAARVMERAVVEAVKHAKSLCGITDWQSLK
ncbi:MAG: P1 family peptidase [Desulfobacteraceae bacterium]|nr:P1 family peptidase [Desulfobacteraceae bacterium]